MEMWPLFQAKRSPLKSEFRRISEIPRFRRGRAPEGRYMKSAPGADFIQTSGLGRTPALSAISGTLCSHSMAMRWTPATPSIDLNS